MVEITYKGIHHFLSELQIESELDGQLQVFLGQDSKERDLYLNIRITEADLSDAQKGVDSYQMVQFMLILPFEIEPAFFASVARKLVQINRSLEMSGFELSEPDKRVYFRYGIPVMNHEMDDAIFATIIGTIESAVDMFSGQIEANTGAANGH